MDKFKYILIFLLAQFEFTIPVMCMKLLNRPVIEDSPITRQNRAVSITNVMNDGLELDLSNATSTSTFIENQHTKSTSALEKFVSHRGDFPVLKRVDHVIRSTSALEKFVPHSAAPSVVRKSYLGTESTSILDSGGNNLAYSNSRMRVANNVKSPLVNSASISKINTDYDDDITQRNIVNNVDIIRHVDTIEMDANATAVAINNENIEAEQKDECNIEIDKFNNLYQSLPDNVKSTIGERDFGYIFADVNAIEAWKARETLILALCTYRERIYWNLLRATRKFTDIGGWLAGAANTAFPVLTVAFPNLVPQMTSNTIITIVGIFNMIMNNTRTQLENHIKVVGRVLLWKKIHKILTIDKTQIPKFLKNSL